MVGSTDQGAVADEQPQWHDVLRTLIDDAREASLADGLRRTCHSAADLLDCRCVIVTVVDRDGGLEHFISADRTGQTVDSAALLPVRDGLLAPVIDAGRIVSVSGDDRALELAQVTSVLGVPIDLDGSTIGGLYACDPSDGGAFSAEDERLGMLLVRIASSVIGRARLNHAAEQRQRWLSESAALTRALLSGDDVSPLRLVVERVRDMADADLVAVLAERSEGSAYEVIEAAGPHAGALVGRTVAAGTPLAARVLADGAPRVVSDLSSGGRHAELADIIGAESAILAPFSGGGVDRGLLTMYRRPERAAFTAAEIDAATMFAAQLSLALELADSRAQRERSALLDERGRIARDLHDHVIQRLFAIGLTTQSVTAQVDNRAAGRLQDCVEGIDETIAQIRSTIYRLTGPLVSAENSIRTRAARLVEDMAPVLGFRAELDVRGPVDFGVEDDLTDDCIAVLREALTNAAKHAQASRVAVTITVSAAELTLEVADDGRGIGAVSRRSGLANLRTRAERRSGRLIVASGTPRGTRLDWTVPLGNANRPVRSVG
jgi:signal transduction histidine kinase